MSTSCPWLHPQVLFCFLGRVDTSASHAALNCTNLRDALTQSKAVGSKPPLPSASSVQEVQ